MTVENPSHNNAPAPELVERYLANGFRVKWGLGQWLILGFELFALLVFMGFSVWADKELVGTWHSIMSVIGFIPFVRTLGYAVGAIWMVRGVFVVMLAVVFYFTHGFRVHYVDREGIRKLIGFKKRWRDFKDIDKKVKHITVKRQRGGRTVGRHTEWTVRLTFSKGSVVYRNTVLSPKSFHGLDLYCAVVIAAIYPERFGGKMPQASALTEAIAASEKLSEVKSGLKPALCFIVAVLVLGLALPSAFFAVRGAAITNNLDASLARDKARYKEAKRYKTLVRKKKLPITKCKLKNKHHCKICWKTDTAPTRLSDDEVLATKGDELWRCPSKQAYAAHYTRYKDMYDKAREHSEGHYARVLQPAGAVGVVGFPLFALILGVVGWRLRK